MRFMKTFFMIGAVAVALALSACVHGGVSGSKSSSSPLNLEGKFSVPLGK